MLGVEPEPFSATKEALTASTIAAIRAGSWTLAATTGAETVDGDCSAEVAAEAGNEGTTRLAAEYPMANSPRPD